ncbi:MAG: hypothetical protein K2K67_03130 [Treponemataceae bacterium]|nr:hypothetical protein [Treponemataceae bacterium]
MGSGTIRVRERGFPFRQRHVPRMRILPLAALLLLAAVRSPAELFNAQLSNDERDRLYRGEIVIRHINTSEKICVVPGASAETDAVANAMRGAQVNYLSEVLWALPLACDGQLTDLVESLFRDMDTFREIPYYSESSGKTEPLFTVADLIETETDGTETRSTARFCMEPFEPYPANLYMRKTPTAFVFLHTNTEKIRLAIVRAIAKDTMKAGVAIVQDGGYWIVYGAGGIRGPKPPFLKKSLEKAFNNRIKDFATFYIRKVQDAEANALPAALRQDARGT